MGGFVAVLKILGETAASSEPSEGSFDDPPSWNDLEADHRIGSFDVFSFQAGQYFLLRVVEDRPLVSTVGKEFFQKRKLAEQGSEDQNAPIAIPDICRMDDGVKQQAYSVDKNMTLLACIVARRIYASPFFSAFFTL